MEKEILEKFKSILEKEKLEIAGELDNIAIQNKTDPNEWIGKFPSGEAESGHAAVESLADEIEDYASNAQIAKTLSQKLADINLALDKLANNTYGKCENCGKNISIDRLDAMPEARFCYDCAEK